MSDADAIETYLEALRIRLALCPGRVQDLLDEVRDHLQEARDAAVLEGSEPAAAARAVVADFGDAALLARRLIAQRSRRRAVHLLPLALALGAGMAWIDSRPTWDDTGVSAFAVLGACAAFALLEPRRPWLWALAIGGWFPLLSIATSGNWGAFAALAVGCIGACGGSWMRRAVAAQD